VLVKAYKMQKATLFGVALVVRMGQFSNQFINDLKVLLTGFFSFG